MRNEVQIISYGDFLVSSEIVTEHFSCDLGKCHGVCCVEGNSGAPLKLSECRLLERDYPAYSVFMTSEGRDAAERKGFFDVDTDGDIVTPLIGKEGPCAYSFMENGSCFCAIERAYCRGLCKFRKPVSCHLYPVRVRHLPSGFTQLELNRWKICEYAFENGAAKKVPVYKFLREPLIDAFGQDLYDALDAFALRLVSG